MMSAVSLRAELVTLGFAKPIGAPGCDGECLGLGFERLGEKFVALDRRWVDPSSAATDGLAKAGTAPRLNRSLSSTTDKISASPQCLKTLL
jgi:hypothetical protein